MAEAGRDEGKDRCFRLIQQLIEGGWTPIDAKLEDISSKWSLPLGDAVGDDANLVQIWLRTRPEKPMIIQVYRQDGVTEFAS